ncbi:MAG: hypothetical protein MZV64_48910 [Ignavibacteriales bacterium]|nr:hypothetical protein [Ignavibacteriales bacterium]
MYIAAAQNAFEISDQKLLRADPIITWEYAYKGKGDITKAKEMFQTCFCRIQLTKKLLIMNLV